MAWMTLAELFQTMFAPPEGKTFSAAQTSLLQGPTPWHMHGPGLQKKGIQGGDKREGCGKSGRKEYRGG